jgi:hypothetical protein
VCWRPFFLGQNYEQIFGLSVSIGKAESMPRNQSFRSFLTNMSQPMPLPEKLGKLVRNFWRRAVLRQNCCGHPGEPGC